MALDPSLRLTNEYRSTFHRTCVATWNVQTLLRHGAATLLSQALTRYVILPVLCESQ